MKRIMSAVVMLALFSVAITGSVTPLTQLSASAASSAFVPAVSDW